MVFSCYIIGRTTLLVRCAEMILEHGNIILGIVSVDKAVKKFAEDKKIKLIPFDSLLSFLLDSPCDYLFSIFNNRLLNEQHLSSPKRYAINCHDGPLPRYGGVNAACWAIINTEKEHGITWHKMVLEVDGGPLLQQPLFPLSPNETTFTLRLKCWENAQASFSNLVGGLMGDDYEALCKPQGNDRKSYFTRFKRPASSCFIDFHTQTAHQIEALIRALDFGTLDVNPMGSAKIMVGRSIIVSTQASLVGDNKATAAVGEVIGVDNESIIVKTKEGCLRLEGLMTVYGVKQTTDEIKAREPAFGAGYMMKPIHSLQLSELGEVCAKHEEFWVRRLEKIRTPALFQQCTESLLQRITVALGPSIKPIIQNVDDDELIVYGIAAFVYLLQIFGRDDEAFDIGIQYTGENPLPNTPFLEYYLPFHVNFISSSTSVEALLASIRKELAFSDRGCLGDVFQRYPSLSTKRAQHSKLFSVAVQQVKVESKRGDDPNIGVDFVFQCSKGAEWCWNYRPSVLLDEQMISHMISVYKV